MSIFADVIKILKLVRDFANLKAKRGPRVDMILPPPPRVPREFDEK